MALARMIIVDELHFRFVEHDGFIYFMGVVEPRFPMPSHLMVARDCIKLWFVERENLISYLKLGQRVSLITDTWTSIQNLNYMCLTCHYIDGDWTYQKRILNFCIVPNHNGETIGKTIERCLNDWGIKMVITITVDNAKTNDVAVDYLKKKLEMKDGCMLGGQFLHMRCAAHVLNLIVQEELKGIHNSIVKVRNALRWNSTYFMLEVAEKFETAFDRMHEEDVEFSSYFMEVDGNGKHKHIGPPKVGIQNELHRLSGIDGDHLLKEMAQSMKEKYEKYWGDIKNMNLMMFIAVVLDPRYKMKYWFNKWYSKEKAEFALKLVRGALDKLYAHYVKESSASFPYDLWKIASHEFDEHIATEDDNECTTDVDKYLNEASEKNSEGFDILAWWKVNSTRYVIFSEVA
ncbi:hypothetical protein RGQ29_014736 [Quercus rubra]|uniref:hAT-like transposase RNase-H fold domain-containing protein n=1 Tax=Quercus rubra TaxID=3512 RepID=A0AAN7FN42_QUERU|nr:hypothetical protein RGQ29_014736 [Quercus rubra]